VREDVGYEAAEDLLDVGEARVAVGVFFLGWRFCDFGEGALFGAVGFSVRRRA
jgi:hypothetical protein